MQKLHPGAKWLFRIDALYLAFPLLMGILIPFNVLYTFFLPLEPIDRLSGLGSYLWPVIKLEILFGLGFIVIFGEVYARMAYNRWKYEFTPNSLKLERGIILKRYSNIPYARIQNVEIYRGILARIFGFSEIEIQTAGYSGMPISEGYIPAVDPKAAEQIRDFLIKKSVKGRRMELVYK